MKRSDQLLKVILIFTAVTMLAVWLPLIRGVMDGPSYEWGTSFLGKDFGGNGVAGDYWFVVAQAVVALAIMYLGWRGARQPFHWLLLLWTGSSLVNAIYNAVKFPDDYRFKGDTMGLDVSLAWIAPLFWFVLTLLAVVWVVKDLRNRTEHVMPRWTRRNTFLMVLVFAIMPVQFYLLRSGGPDDLRDQQGVVLTIAQWILLNIAFASKSAVKTTLE